MYLYYKVNGVTMSTMVFYFLIHMTRVRVVKFFVAMVVLNYKKVPFEIKRHII